MAFLSLQITEKQLGPCGMLLAEFMVSPPLATASVS